MTGLGVGKRSAKVRRVVIGLASVANGDNRPMTRATVTRLLEPYRVVFGHDHAIWQPDA